MGQYHKVFNIDKREFIHGHYIGNGLKLMEQCGESEIPTTSDALWLLLANSNGRGGGDAEEHNLIGHWAGDRIVVQGDYAEVGDDGYVSELAMTNYADISIHVRGMLETVFGSPVIALGE